MFTITFSLYLVSSANVTILRDSPLTSFVSLSITTANRNRPDLLCHKTITAKPLRPSCSHRYTEMLQRSSSVPPDVLIQTTAPLLRSRHRPSLDLQRSTQLLLFTSRSLLKANIALLSLNQTKLLSLVLLGGELTSQSVCYMTAKGWLPR